MAVTAGPAATVVPVDTEAEAARVVPAGQRAAAVNPVNLARPVNPANLAGSRRGAAQMAPEPSLNVQTPRVGRDVDSQRGPASDAYQAASEPCRSVMVLLAKLIGL